MVTRAGGTQLSACGGGGGSGQSAVAVTGDSAVPPVPTQAWTDHYVGAVKIADASYFGDAVFTRDGTVRLYVGGPYDDGGELQVARPETSEQFVGTIQMRDSQWSGSGVIIGQECAINPANRFCVQTGSADVSGTLQFDAASGTEHMQGEIQVATTSGKETWLLDLLLWSDSSITPSEGTGQFKEMVGEFAYGGDVIMSFDSSGKFFFQSANSGCVGNGMLVPTLDGSAGLPKRHEATAPDARTVGSTEQGSPRGRTASGQPLGSPSLLYPPTDADVRSSGGGAAAR
jgi:hypothetical protein